MLLPTPMTLGKERGSEDTLGVRMKGEFLLEVFKELSGTESSTDRGLWLPAAIVTGKPNDKSSVDRGQSQTG